MVEAGGIVGKVTEIPVENRELGDEGNAEQIDKEVV